MAVVMDNALFLHIPKTGGEWVRQVLWDAGLETVKLHPGKQKHADLRWFKEHPEYDRPFRFAFVRHPLGWYRSYWTYQRGRGWKEIPEVGLTPPDPAISFDDFVCWMAEEHPGFLMRLYRRYIGPEDNEIDYVARSEELRIDLPVALALCGSPVPYRLIDTVPRLNATLSWETRFRSLSAYKALVRSEAECFKYIRRVNDAQKDRKEKAVGQGAPAVETRL
jgi:hypothetical protein